MQLSSQKNEIPIIIFGLLRMQQGRLDGADCYMLHEQTEIPIVRRHGNSPGSFWCTEMPY